MMQKAEKLSAQAVSKAGEQVGKLSHLLDKFDNDGDGKADLAEAKVTVSKFAQSHKGLAAGFVGGAVIGYRLG